MKMKKTFAFLDINPETPGHTLVIPKTEVDRIYDLSDEDYAAVWATVKKLAANMEKSPGEKDFDESDWNRCAACTCTLDATR